MSHIVRIIFALQICFLFVAGCAVDDDGATDTEATVDRDVADHDISDEVTPDLPEAALETSTAADAVTTKALCQRIRLNNRATLATCRSTCSSRGQTALGFDNVNKICRCCSPGPL